VIFAQSVARNRLTLIPHLLEAFLLCLLLGSQSFAVTGQFVLTRFPSYFWPHCCGGQYSFDIQPDVLGKVV
jgi:hypothetical protein